MTQSEPATPRPAATIMLLRDGPDGIEVFMQVRHQAMQFAAGALVFPGGRLEQSDHDLAQNPALCTYPNDSRGIDFPFWVAAIRETFEECGIMLARSQGSGDPIQVDRLEALRSRYKQDGGHRAGSVFADMLTTERLVLALDLLVPFARWITPAHSPKRFDTVFLLARAPAEQIGAHDGTESVDSVWLTPEAALAGAESGTYKLVFATSMNLKKLDRFADADAALKAAQRAAVVTVTPEVLHVEGTRRRLRIPIEADYGGDIFDVDRHR